LNNLIGCISWHAYFSGLLLAAQDRPTLGCTVVHRRPHSLTCEQVKRSAADSSPLPPIKSVPPLHLHSLVEAVALKIHRRRLPFTYIGPPPLSGLRPYIKGTKSPPQLMRALVSLLLTRSTVSMSSKHCRLYSSSSGHLIHPIAVCCCW
jgi:hypothetical protein